MATHSDYLEQELRQNLRLRRELGARAAEAKGAIEAKQGGGTASRLGWFLYWTCLVLAVTWAGFVALFVWEQGDLPRHLLVYSLGFFIPMVLLYGTGRAFRYILSEE